MPGFGPTRTEGPAQAIGLIGSAGLPGATRHRAVMEREEPMSSFVDIVQSRLSGAGLGDAELVSATPESAAFGDTTAVFRIRPLLLRFTRERGQEFVDLASQSEPDTFHQFDDVDIAMGWRSVDEVLAKRKPEPIAAVLRRIKANLAVLGDAFSGDRERLTRARVERAARERGHAFTARLRGNG